MDKFPQPFWAILLAILGVVLCVVTYLLPRDATAEQASFGIAQALVTGALGAFAGHALAKSEMKPENPPQNNPNSGEQK